MNTKCLDFFETPKDNLKINILYRNEEALSAIRESSPEPTSLPDVSRYYTDILFPPAPAHRPYIFSSIVLSADGKMAFMDNKAGPLVAKNNYLDPDGSLADFWVLNVLRAYSDGVVVGGNTMKNEPGISSHCYDVSLVRQRRELLGKPNPPATVIVSLDGTDVPFDHHSLHIRPEDRYKVFLATSPKGFAYLKEHSPLRHRVYGPFTSKAEVDAFRFPPIHQEYDVVPLIVTGEEALPDTELLMYVLKKLGMERLCIESPTYTAHLMTLGFLDEYFINYSMVYAGGMMTPGYAVPQGYLNHAHSQLLSVGMHAASFLFTRQKLCYGVAPHDTLKDFHY